MPSTSLQTSISSISRIAWPFELLDAMNVVVKFTDKFPKDGLKGFCTFINKTRYVVINDRLSSVEARVVAGHEAGHIIRHAAELKIGAFQDNDIYMATGKKEREANVFAADFLIRDADVLELMQSCDSNFFNVSKALRIPAPFFAFKLYSMVERGHPDSRFRKLPIYRRHFSASGYRHVHQARDQP